MTIPTGVLAIPMGRSLLVMWDVDPLIEYYNIYKSMDNDGFDVVMNYITGSHASLGSLPTGVPIYIKVDGILHDGQYTDKVNAKLGGRLSDQITVAITTMPGSTIAKDTITALRPLDPRISGDVLVKFPSEVNF